MTSYPAPAGAPPGFDGDGEGYPTHNPYAAAHGYAYAPGQPDMRPPPAQGGFVNQGASNWAQGGAGSNGGRRNRRSAASGGRFDALVQRSPLRSMIIFTAFLSGVYLFVAAYSNFRAIARNSEPGKLKVFDGIQGGLFLFAGAIEAFGVFAAVKAVFKLARLYSLASCVSLACTLTGELLGIIIHFTSKQTIIDACTKLNTGQVSPSWNYGWWGSNNYYGGDENAPVVSANGTATIPVFSEADARKYCTDTYNRYTPWSIVWFLATAFIGALFVVLSFAFAKQLLDPAAGRSRTQVAPSAQYRNGGDGGQMPELRYDSYPMGAAQGGAGGYGAGRRSTDSDYAWDSRDVKSPTYDPYSYGKFDEDENARRGGGVKGGPGADGDASTLVGDAEEDRKNKFGAVGQGDEEDRNGSSSRPGSSRGVRPADNPV
ncbi:hypothetical protein CF319_g3016 [Tilletia indica]|nr:hypothetical protein CF319_g3016 [Tilletia indica]